MTEAIEYYDKALEINPQNADAIITTRVYRYTILATMMRLLNAMIKPLR